MAYTVLGGQEHIAGGQVSVHDALLLQVAHGVRYLAGVAVEQGESQQAPVLLEVVAETAKRSQLLHLGTSV